MVELVATWFIIADLSKGESLHLCMPGDLGWSLANKNNIASQRGAPVGALPRETISQKVWKKAVIASSERESNPHM